MFVELKLYDYLFKTENPNESENWLDEINPDSLVTVPAARFPASMKHLLVPETHMQFERHGYFCVDRDTTDTQAVINKTVSL
jgi:glutaminyl-tRNA synthetase